MKTNLLTLAATLLLAASANTAFADIEYYLVGTATGWNLNSDYKFESTESGIYTLTKTLSGEFKLQQKNGDVVTWVGANSNGVYQATANYPTANLIFNGGNNLNLQFEAEYTFTLNTNNQYTLNIGGLDGFLVAGTFNGWSPKSMTKQSDGSYIFPVDYFMFDSEGKLQFKIVDFNNKYYGGSSNTSTHELKWDWHTNISLVGDGSKNFEITDAENITIDNCKILVKDGKVSLLGYSIDIKSDWLGGFAQYNNQVFDVNLYHKFYCDGYWNTICLPFDITDIQNTIFSDATIAYLNNSELNGGTLTLGFSTVQPGESMVAGRPYLVKWDNRDNFNFTTIYGVIINSNANTVTSTDVVDFIGCFFPKNIEGDTYLYLGEENTLYYPSSEITLGTSSAYFELKLPSGQQAKSFVLNFGDDNETTSIKEVSQPSTLNSELSFYFTLDGRRINDMPATPGLYIINGKKVVIK